MTRTMTTMKTLTATAFALALFVAPAVASATPPADHVTLAPQAAQTLRSAVASARASDPGAFADVASLVRRTPELDRKARSGKAPVSLALASMGPRAVMPLAELAGLEPPSGLTREQVHAARLPVLEALGMLRDARVAPVLFAWLEQADADTTRVAAEAVARLDTDEAGARLVSALSRATGERAVAILAGMGMCHRASVAKALADRLGQAPDEATARVVVKSLRRAASPWAWQTLARRDEEGAVRDLASEALVGAFVRYEGETRDAAEKALAVVDDGRVARFVQVARSRAASPKQGALDGLAARLAARPKDAKLAP